MSQKDSEKPSAAGAADDGEGAAKATATTDVPQTPSTSAQTPSGEPRAPRFVRVRAFLAALLGTWSPPPWFARLSQRFSVRAQAWGPRIARRKVPIVVGVALVAALVWGVPWIRYFLATRPGPPWLTLSIDAPSPTPLDGKDRFDDLVIRLSIPAARLDVVGKLAGGVTLSPAVDGEWRWRDDKTLAFQPRVDWAVDTEYTVSFARTVFTDDVRIDALSHTFRTERFAARVEQSEFYQDPTDRKVKKLVASVRFNYPVDRARFEKNVRVSLVTPHSGAIPDERETIGFSVQYDPHGALAHVHSDVVALPKEDQRIELVVDEGIASARGGRPTEAPLTASVFVPGVYSFFKVQSVHAQWVDDELDRPRLALLASFTDGVTTRDLDAHVEAWVLPETRPAQEKRKAHKSYRWSSPQEISPADLAAARALDLTPDPVDTETTPRVSFALTDVTRPLFVRVRRGLTSEGGYELPADVDFVVQVPELDIKLDIAHDGNILSLSGERSLALVSRGLTHVDVTLGRVIASEVNHLVTQTNGDLAQLRFGSGYDGSEGEYDEGGDEFVDEDVAGDEGESFDEGEGEYGSEGDGYEGDGYDGYDGYGGYRPVTFGEDNITDRFTLKRALEMKDRASPQYSSIDFTPYVRGEGGDKPGLFFVKLTGRAPDGRTVVVKRFVLVTDLGVLTKQGVDKGFDVFVQSFASGRPVDGAQVSVLTKNGRSLARATTVDGRVHFKRFTGKGPLAPIAFLVQQGGDASFVPLDRRERRLNLSRFDVGGVRAHTAKDELTAFTFSDRGIYRPGERIDFAAIVRSRKLDVDVKGILVVTEVRDVKGRVLHEQHHTLKEGGLIDFSTTTDKTSPTGQYTATVRLVEKRKSGALETTRQLGATTVRVEEFLPDTMKIAARLSAARLQGWVKPDGLSTTVTLENLFGAPAADRTVRATAYITPVSPTFSAHDGFTFAPREPLHGTRMARNAYQTALGDHTTDENGQVSLPIDLSGARSGFFSLTVVADGFDAGEGRSVSASVNTYVSLDDVLIGTKADGPLFDLPRDSARTVEFVAVDESLKKVARAGLTLLIEEETWVSVLVERPNGTLAYQSERRIVERTRTPLSLTAKGHALALATATPGSFRVSLVEGEERLATFAYSVAGRANVARHMEKNAELTLSLKRTDVSPGEDLEIAIRAPYAGSGLITLEGDSVQAHRWFTTSTTSTVERITVPAGMEGNAYVHVTLLRDAASRDVFTSPLSTGVVPFTLSRDARTVKIALERPARARPGEEIAFRVSADKPARAVVYAVDEGILQVAGYQTPNPLAHFFRKRALQVTTWQLLDLLLPESSISQEVSASGGGDDEGEAMLGANLNPFQRNVRAPVVVWSGVVDIGPTAKTHSIRVPDDFNGALRVMAVASSKSAIGAASEIVRVRGDVVLSATAPLFAAPGDTFSVSVGVSNQLEGSGEVPIPIEVTIEPSKHVTVTSQKAVVVEVAERREGKVRFDVRVNDELGGATLRFVARAKPKSADVKVDEGRATATFSVRPPVAFLSTVWAGHVPKGERAITFDRLLYPHHATHEVQVGAVPLTVAKGLYRYVSDFPYGCTEQLVSRAMSAMLLSDVDDIGVSRSDAGKMMASTKSALRFRQTDTGAFGVWAANATQVPHHTVYAAHYMLEAKERGHPIDHDVLVAALRVVATIGATEPRSLEEARLAAYALYVMAMSGKVVTRELDALVDVTQRAWPESRKADLFRVWAGGTYALLKNEAKAKELLTQRTFFAALTGRVYFDDQLASNAQLLYVVAKHMPAALKNLVTPEGLTTLLEPLSRHGYNTLSSSYTILALRAYVDAVGGFTRDDKTATVRVPTGLIAADTVVGGQQAFDIVEVLPTRDAGGNATLRGLTVGAGAFPRVGYGDTAVGLRITNRRELPIFYQVTHAGFDRAPPTVPIKDSIDVTREFRVAGRPVTKVQVGDDVEVHVIARAVGRTHIPNVAIVDLLPTGFEIDLDTARSPLATEGVPSFTPEHVDLREDRALVFTTITDRAGAYAYRARATVPGTFVVPPAQAASMYELPLRGRGASSTIEVVSP